MIITGVLFDIKIANKQISSRLKSLVKQMELIQKLNQTSRMNIHLAYDEYIRIDEAFQTGELLHVSLPYMNQLVPVFEGKITGKFLESDYVTGNSMILKAKDYLVELKRTGFEFYEEKYSLIQLIKKIASNENFRIDISNVLDIDERFILREGSKFDLLSYLCSEFGLKFFLRGKSLFIFTIDSIPFDDFPMDIVPLFPCVTRHSAEESLLPESVRIIQVLERDADADHLVAVKTHSTDQTMEGMTTPLIFSYPFPRAEGLVRQIAETATLGDELELSVPGDPRLHPGLVLEVKDKNFPVRFLFLKEVHHLFNDLGYRTRITGAEYIKR